MFLDINVYNIIYTSVFLLVFVISYFVVLCSNFEKLFKQGYIWAIRLGQILLALAISYLVTSGIMLLVNSTQFSIN
ncbi:MAG: DUF1146 domain-containing protein [Acholeplasmatales bacterium]|nr:DUF1146 domain-containing protein [Acholeplasmatales bacterium]